MSYDTDLLHKCIVKNILYIYIYQYILCNSPGKEKRRDGDFCVFLYPLLKEYLQIFKENKKNSTQSNWKQKRNETRLACYGAFNVISCKTGADKMKRFLTRCI